jgi:hypothetical protein
MGGEGQRRAGLVGTGQRPFISAATAPAHSFHGATASPFSSVSLLFLSVESPDGMLACIMVRPHPAAQRSAPLLNEVKEPLQVRIPSGIKRQFKAAAALRGLEPNELFVEVWQHYERTRQDALPPVRK